MRKADGKRPLHSILANRPLLQQPVDFGFGLDQVEFLDFSRYVVNSQFHSGCHTGHSQKAGGQIRNYATS